MLVDDLAVRVYNVRVGGADELPPGGGLRVKRFPVSLSWRVDLTFDYFRGDTPAIGYIQVLDPARESVAGPAEFVIRPNDTSARVGLVHFVVLFEGAYIVRTSFKGRLIDECPVAILGDR